MNAQVENAEVEKDPIADPSYDAAFNRIRGVTPDPAEEPAQIEEEAPAAADVQPADEPAAETPPEKSELAVAMETIAGLQSQISKLAGNMGGMKQVVDSLRETVQTASKAGHETPTQQQVSSAVEAAAAGDYDELNAIAEDFPDLGAALKKAMARQTAELAKQIPKVDLNAIADQVAQRASSSASTAAEAAVAKARALARIDLAHDGWEETVKTPEFDAWFKAQPAEMQALAESDSPKDSIKLLDAFAARKAPAAKTTKRLESAVPAKSAGAGGPPQISEDQAYDVGFSKVMRQRRGA